MTEYVIWSIEHDAWWKPARTGYTRELVEAGIYAEREARAIVQRANLVAFHECMIPVEAFGLAAAAPDPTPPLDRPLGDLLQWLAAADPAYLDELEGHVRAHIANQLRR